MSDLSKAIDTAIECMDLVIHDRATNEDADDIRTQIDVLEAIARTHVWIDRERLARLLRVVAEEVRISEWASFETQEMADALNALQPGDLEPTP